MKGKIIVSKDCAYFWSIQCDNINIEGRCNFSTPERAVRSARHYAEILNIIINDTDPEMRCL